MVSHEQYGALTRRIFGALLTLAIVASPALGQARVKKFYPDDPLLIEPSPRPVKHLAKRHVDDVYDFLMNSFATPHRAAKAARQGPRTAQDVNTLGDVPDSAWYTKRHFYRRMSIEELKRGPGNNTPPSARGPWRIISAKSDGVTPGFVIEDEHETRYLLKLDPPEYPELASAADVIGSKAFYALGYNTPENYLVHFRPETLEIAGSVMWRDATGKKRPLTRKVLEDMLKPQPKGEDGSYRGLASRWIPGEVVGPFIYEGMRTDDPNDTVPHEDRRALRGLKIFAAWLNHHDTKAINTMDSLVSENGTQYLKHYLIDFGGILGSDGIRPKYTWSGNEYTIDGKGSLAQMVTFGFYLPRWRRAYYPKLPGVGLIDSWSFDPLSWKPNYQNPAFLRMDREDAYWAAKQVASFTDAEIRALVETGEFSDPGATEWITRCLIERRDKIAKAWFSKVLPLDAFSVSDGTTLTFEDLGKVGEYSIRWSSADKNGVITRLPDASGARVPAPRSDTEYVLATIEPAGTGRPSNDAIIVYLRPSRAGIEVVGVDRDIRRRSRRERS